MVSLTSTVVLNTLTPKKSIFQCLPRTKNVRRIVDRLPRILIGRSAKHDSPASFREPKSAVSPFITSCVVHETQRHDSWKLRGPNPVFLAFLCPVPMYHARFAPYMVIQDRLGFWILRREFRISIVREILEDSLS